MKITGISLHLSRIGEYLLPHFGKFDFIREIFGTRMNWKIPPKTVIFVISAFFFGETYQFALNQPRDRRFHFFEGSALDFYSKTYGNNLALGLIFIEAFAAAALSVCLWKILLN